MGDIVRRGNAWYVRFKDANAIVACEKVTSRPGRRPADTWSR